MTETIKYQSNSTLPREETSVSFARRSVLLRRYDRLLSYGVLLARVISNVQFNLSIRATSDALRRSR